MTAPPPVPKFSLPAAWRPKVRPSTTRLLKGQQQQPKVVAAAPVRPHHAEVKVEQPDNMGGPVVTAKPEVEYEDVTVDDEEAPEGSEKEEDPCLASAPGDPSYHQDPQPQDLEGHTQPSAHHDEEPAGAFDDVGGVPTSPAGGFVEDGPDEVEGNKADELLPEEKVELMGLKEEKEEEQEEEEKEVHGDDGGSATPWKRRTEKRARHRSRAAAAGARAKSAAGSSSQPTSGEVSGGAKPSDVAESAQQQLDQDNAQGPT